MTNDTLLALAINRLEYLKANEKTLLADIVDTVAFYRALTVNSLSRVVGRQLRAESVAVDDTLRVAERDFEFCTQRQIQILPIWHPRYPASLREIFDPPFLVFVRGNLPDSDKPNVAIVGTREPTAGAVVATEHLASGIAVSGLCVVSGLARGIDAAAHSGALRFVGTGSFRETSPPTGAVLGCGIDRICPSSNRGLAGRILDAGGFVLSEYSPGVGSQKYHFPARNRIISGLSRGVVVTQAPSRSGALITADYALDQGRDLFVHSAGLDGPLGAGTRDLADDGACIVDSALDVLSEWGIAGEPVPAPGGLKDSPARAGGSALHAGRELAEELRTVLGPEAAHG